MNSNQYNKFIFTSHFLLTLFFFLYSFSSFYHLGPIPAAAEVASTPVTRFQEYLRINTAHPNPNYISAITFLTRQAQSIGGITIKTLEFVPGKPILVLSWQGSDPSLSSILLNSHLDSVPAEPSKWLHPPFSATRSSDGKIYARGAQDDKCTSIQYLEAIRNLRSRQNSSFKPIRTVHVVYIPDEEIGGFDGWGKFAESEEFKELNVGFALDEGQTNPSGEEFRVFYAERQPMHLVIRAYGEPGHGARMYDDSAMENLMKSIEVIGKYRESQFDLLKYGLARNSEIVSVNPVYLKAGVPSNNGFVMNMQPSEAEAGFDIRMPPTCDPDVIQKRITEEWAPSSRNMTFEIKVKGHLRDYLGRPLMTIVNDLNPWWSVFKQAVTSAGGKLAEPEVSGSTSDSRYLRQIGVPVLGFSPMKNTPILVHDHNEYLEESVFLNGIKVYESILSSLSSFTGGCASSS